jgi:uncharacterized protein
MIDRKIADATRALSRQYPVVVITGPRQSGKTTLARQIFADHPYLNLEIPDVRRRIEADPRGFLTDHPDGAILDEAQRVPEILSYLQGAVDDDRRPGRFILTGSQQFGLLAGVTQSLAGRAAMLELLPFSASELAMGNWMSANLAQALWSGFYPPIHDRGLDPASWFRNYVTTFIERDVRQLINVRDLLTFDTFLRMCAARCGQLVNLSGLASDCGITHNTARAWLSVLEASYVVRLLPPHHRNFSKRLIKSPKLYFIDPGLAAWLLEIRTAEQLATHPMRGALFETWVHGELLKNAANHAERPALYFWRDRAGLEIDFIVDRGTKLIPIEVKSGATFVWDWLEPLERWQELAGEAAGPAWIIHGGEDEGARRAVASVPWRRVELLLAQLNLTY